MSPYRTIDHTADTGIEIEGESLSDLFRAAGEAFCDVVCDRSTIRPVVERRLSVQRKNREELLQGFLSELLYRFETDHELYSSVVVPEIGEGRVTAVVKGEKFDPKRHEIRTGIKAVTFHQLKIWQEEGLWKARVIFDV